ncbi:hypothetical protein GQ44DRAFT_747421 [Phaeosphaeriaceae sp. PMI808]|nr:hypothetical protein GQ44DRAFT_747421 [Phaeosphaeriaceae sp. PMI808]
MADCRKFGDQRILKSLKQIDQQTWLIGNLILQRIPDSSTKFAIWEDEDGSSFLLSAARKPLPPASIEIDSLYITLIHEAGDASAVWAIRNNAICKARYTHPGITSESATLQFRVPGTALFKLWPIMGDIWRQKCVDEIVRVIQEMEQWRGALGGVDGQGLLENWLLVPKTKRDYTPENLRASCEDLGMDCSDCVFYHADLAPTNILIEDEPQIGRISRIDFEMAGFFPKA